LTPSVGVLDGDAWDVLRAVAGAPAAATSTSTSVAASAAGFAGERRGDESESEDDGANLRCMGDAAVDRFNFLSVGGGESKLCLGAALQVRRRHLSV
jgi:hypothetical protein